MRHLATIREIVDIIPIPNADRIELAIVDGWECVVKKSDNFKIHDKVIYIEVDSIMPNKPEFDFLKESKYRIKTRKFRKQISQGLVLPLSYLKSNNYNLYDDVTEEMGIIKYDPEEIEEQKIIDTKKTNFIIKYLLKYKFFRKIYLSKDNKGFPEWIEKTDEERIQNKTILFDKLYNDKTELIETEKVDGTSATYFFEVKQQKIWFLNKLENFGICSRKINISKCHNTNYYKIAINYNIKNTLKNILSNLQINDKYDKIYLQGEIIGEGIQGNKYGVNLDFYAHKLVAYNSITKKKFEYDYIKFKDILLKYGIKTVPIINENFILPESINLLIDHVKGKSVINTKSKREGSVFRTHNCNDNNIISFKAINPEFLLESE